MSLYGKGKSRRIIVFDKWNAIIAIVVHLTHISIVEIRYLSCLFESGKFLSVYSVYSTGERLIANHCFVTVSLTGTQSVRNSCKAILFEINVVYDGLCFNFGVRLPQASHNEAKTKIKTGFVRIRTVELAN